MFSFNSICVNFVSVVLSLFVIIIAYYKWKYQYWRRRNMPFLEPTIPFGNTSNPFTVKENIGYRLKRHYDKVKARGWKHSGLYMILNPSYIIVDLDYVKNVMAKDFHYFVDRGFFYNEKDDPLSAHLIALGGQRWKDLRAKVTPTFTTGKMKMMFQTLVDCVPNLLERIDELCNKNTPIDIKEVLGCFTTNIIGSCAFGLNCNTFKEKNSPFREFGPKAVNMTRIQMLKMVFSQVFPNLALYLRLTVTPKDVTKFFMKIVKDTVNYREVNKVTRNDFLQLLIDLKNKNEHALTIDEVAAQSFVFFVAGFETSSTTMTFVLYELARRPELQQKVRDEVETILKKHDGKMTYEAIQEMKYMDQVINETLRMYPPLPFITRRCVKDYKIPDENIIIEKGTDVLIPVMAIHLDEDYYPEPNKFDPERFTEENKNSRHHYAHIPFGEGPRACIGLRFGLMQTKVGLASLLKHYRFSVNEKTEEPLKMKGGSFILAAEGDIWVDANKI